MFVKRSISCLSIHPSIHNFLDRVYWIIGTSSSSLKCARPIVSRSAN